MKKALHFFLLIAVPVSLVLHSGCKKDDDEEAAPSNNNNNTTCNFTTNVVSVDGTVKSVVSDSCRAFGSNYYTEHFVDAAKTEAVAIIFDGTGLPAAGTYTAVNDFAAVAAGKAYVEYYSASSAWQPASGTITVTANGTERTYTFCNFSCSDGSTTKTISIRSTCN